MFWSFFFVVAFGISQSRKIFKPFYRSHIFKPCNFIQNVLHSTMCLTQHLRVYKIKGAIENPLYYLKLSFSTMSFYIFCISRLRFTSDCNWCRNIMEYGMLSIANRIQISYFYNLHKKICLTFTVHV